MKKWYLKVEMQISCKDAIALTGNQTAHVGQAAEHQELSSMMRIRLIWVAGESWGFGDSIPDKKTHTERQLSQHDEQFPADPSFSAGKLSALGAALNQKLLSAFHLSSRLRDKVFAWNTNAEYEKMVFQLHRKHELAALSSGEHVHVRAALGAQVLAVVTGLGVLLGPWVTPSLQTQEDEVWCHLRASSYDWWHEFVLSTWQQKIQISYKNWEQRWILQSQSLEIKELPLGIPEEQGKMSCSTGLLFRICAPRFPLALRRQMALVSFQLQQLEPTPCGDIAQ